MLLRFSTFLKENNFKMKNVPKNSVLCEVRNNANIKKFFIVQQEKPDLAGLFFQGRFPPSRE